VVCESQKNIKLIIFGSLQAVQNADVPSCVKNVICKLEYKNTDK